MFINGAFAGTTHENKTMHLRPGEYNLEIRENGTTPFAQKIFVARGQTLHLHPELYGLRAAAQSLDWAAAFLFSGAAAAPLLLRRARISNPLDVGSVGRAVASPFGSAAILQ